MKKILMLLVILSLSFASVSYAAGVNQQTAIKAKNFPDVPANYWAAGVIESAVSAGFVSGYPDGTFKLEGHVSRAEFVVMMVEALKLQTHPKNPGDAWYQPFVNALQANNILTKSDISGDWSKSATWNQSLTRMEMVRLEVRAVYAAYLNAHMTESDAGYMYKATQTGLISGVGGGYLDEKGLSTRAQAVAVIERVLAAKSGTKLPVDKRAEATAEIAFKGTNMDTMLGVTPKQFPITFTKWNDPKIQITLDKAEVLDCDNPNINPANDWLDHMAIITGDSQTTSVLNSHGYVIAYHFIYHIQAHKNGDKFWEFTPQYSLPYTPTYFVSPKAYYDFQKGKLGIYDIRDGNLNYTHTTDGWMVLWFSKDSPHNTDLTAPQIQDGSNVIEFYVLNKK